MKKIFINGGIFALSIILPAIIECRKHGNPSPQVVTTATIINSGPIAADGCGWLVKIRSVSYHPFTLDSKYQVNDLKVNITYELLADKFQCNVPISATYPGIGVIQIDNISMAN